MRRFLRRVHWSRIGCVALGATAIGLSEELARTRAALNEKETILRMAEARGVDSPPPREWPRIDGRVVMVRDGDDPPQVRLMVRTDEGVMPGMHFTIYRGNQFVAKVVVERVTRDSAECRVLFHAEGQQVRAGDLAASRLS